MTWGVDSHGLVPVSIARNPLQGRGLRRAVAILAAATLAAAPAFAAKPPVKPAKPRFSFETSVTPFQSPVGESATFSFTAPGNGAALARLQTVERAFRFTPSGQSEARKGLSIGVTSKVVTATADRLRAAIPGETLVAVPTAYNVDLSVAWRGFAVNTGYRSSDPGPALLSTGHHDALDIGLSYSGRNWQTSLLGTAERGSLLAYAPLERRYSLELGGAYRLAPRFAVTGGVRYRLAPEAPSLLDPDRADRAVYLGTNIAF